MTKNATLVGVAIAGAGVLATGTPAAAASAGGDEINIANDNNIQVAPVQVCGNNIAIAGAVVPIGSPQVNDCAQGIVEQTAIEHTGVRQPKPATPDPLPAAPTPDPVRGHHAVTG